MSVLVQGMLNHTGLLLCVPGTRGLSVCWLDGDGIFGVGRGWLGGFPVDFVSEGAIHSNFFLL